MSGKIVILTGAGLSAESGLGTFRDAGGLWEKYRLEDVATPEAFARDPATVQAFYNARRQQAAKAEPNAAHKALAELQQVWPDRVVLVTQNVDGLLEKAGATPILMHGQLDQALCQVCDHRWAAPMEMSAREPCPRCQAHAGRPDVVWFGEYPYHLDEIGDHIQDCEVFVAIGTSGQVYPAAGFVQEARLFGARTVEINLESTDASGIFDVHRLGPASATVPAWVSEILSRGV